MRNSADEKYDRILDAAAALFARHPFHKVLLSDVARDASVGKGTLYLYFKSKEELYFAVLFRGFSNLVNRLRETLSTSTSDPEAQLSCIVREMVNKLYANETITELLRGAVVGYPTKEEWMQARRELRGIIESVVRNGVRLGAFEDSNPELTAHYIPGLVRSICLFRPDDVGPDQIADHALDFILKALRPTTRNTAS